MKIMHVTKKYPNALGGDAVVVSNLEKQQMISGHKVIILTSNCKEIKNGKSIHKFGLKDSPAALDKITFRRLISLVMLFYKSYKIIKNEKPDVIHTHSIDMAFFVSFAARKYHVPICHTFHIVTFNDPRQKGLRSKVELFLLKNTNPKEIFILNPADIKDFNAAGFKNVHFIPNGVNIEDWKIKDKVRKNKTFTFIAVGRLEEQKGFIYLIDAAALLRKEVDNFQVLIVGEGSLRTRLEEQIKQNKLQDHVFLLGRKTQEELKKLYAESHVFVLSSLWEGMPLGLLEAWAAKLPAITTNVGAIPYLPTNTSLITPAMDKTMLLKNMYTTLRSSNRRNILIENGYKASKDIYSWNSIVAKINELYWI